MKIERGHTLLVAGPAQVRIRQGSAECLGARIRPDNWTMVEEIRQQPIVSTDSTLFEVKLGYGGSWVVVKESTIPTGWNEAADILQRQRGVTVVVGEVDSGKSSLCTFLANRCVESGMRVGVVDGDVGQADIGPPTTISSSNITAPITSLQQARAKTSFFIGDTSPSSVPDKLIRLLVRLKEELAGLSDAVIVNTDGWIRDPGALQFKQELFHETRPDLVLGLTREDEINPLLDLATCTSLRLPSSVYAKVRSKDERKKTREAGYRRFLLGSRPTRISHERLRLRMFDHPEQSTLQGDRRLRGFLAGLLNREQELLGIGRIRETDDEATIVDTHMIEKPMFLEIGNVALSSRYEEIGYGTLQ